MGGYLDLLLPKNNMKFRHFLLLIFFVFFLLPSCVIPESVVSLNQKDVPVYSYQIINIYPHNTEDFTEGFYYENGAIFESSGQYGESKIKKYDLKTGNIKNTYTLPPIYFGEGVTVLGNKVYQLTWKSKTGFIYDKENLKLSGKFSYKTEGWGLANDGKNLILSNGSNKIYFIDPASFNVIKTIEVKDNYAPVTNINELEYIDGKIYANIFLTDFIAVINPDNGFLEAWIDLTGLLNEGLYTKPVDVLNGIAYDKSTKNLLVTGKYWPFIFEITLK